MMRTAKKQLTVGIVVAMRQEFAAIHQILLPQAPVESYQYSQIVAASVTAINYVIIQSGVGTTNAAIGTCDLLHRYSPDIVLNLGTAALIASADNGLRLADVLAGCQHCQWDLDLGGPITSEWGRKRSFVDVLQTNRLHPDAALYEAAISLSEADDYRLGAAHFYTGNSFFVSDAQHSVLPDIDNPIAVDMESFAVAQVCARKRVPFLCLRGITDTGTESANQDFYANVQAASQASAQAAQHLVQALI